MVPHVSTVTEAHAVVESCRYPPRGHRLIATLETPQAIENADAIAALDGIDILHIDSSDLSTEMGIPG